MEIYTDKKVSPVGSVNKADLAKWFKNMLMFLAPLALVYILQLNAAVQNGVLGFDDLIPTQTTIGAVQLYIINALLDLIRKFTDPKK